MPKTELHVHLEGTLTLARVQALAAETGAAPPRPYAELFQVRSLAEFLATLDWMCGLVRHEAHVRAIARDFLAYAEQQKLMYVELIVNPGHWQLSFDELFEPLAAEFDVAATSGGPDVRLLPSMGRDDSAEAALTLAHWCVDAALPRIAGLSIDGDERAGSYNERFAPAFAHARAHGLPGTAHAGESSGAIGVAEALDVLGVQRIDHGVRAVEDRAIVERLVAERVTLNVCVSSNCALVYPHRDAHPLPALLAAGVACTLNTDDPVVLDLSLNEELSGVAEHFGWALEEVVRCQSRALDAAFCDETTRAGLRQRFDAWAATVQTGEIV